MMFGSIFRFELGYRLRQPILYVFAALFLFMTFSATSSDSFQIGSGIGNVARNAPFIIARTISVVGFIGVILLAIFMATAVTRDREIGMVEILYATPLKKTALLAGRFFAAIILVALATLAGALGIFLATLMPYQNPEQLQSFTLIPYLYTFTVFVLPNLLVAGSIFFAIGVLTRRAMYTYVTMIAFIMLWGFSQSFLGDLESESLAVLIDPLGISAFDLCSRYWTIAERNTMLPPLIGPLLLNRVIWISLSLGLLGLTLWRFRLELGGARGADAPESTDAYSPATNMAYPAAAQHFSTRARWRQWSLLVRDETVNILRSVPFLILLLFGVFNLLGNLTSDFGGTGSYPVTGNMLRSISGGYDLFLLIIIVLYSAELIWRERGARFHEIHGALPLSNHLLLTSKFIALGIVILAAQTIAMFSTIGYQLANGYFKLEPLLYFKGLYLIAFSNWVLLMALALFCQIASRSRYIGFLMMVVYFLGNSYLPNLGYEHHLHLFRSTPTFVQSDMNGYGHFVTPLVHFNIYWAFLAAGMLYLGTLLWPRGSENNLRVALAAMRRDWRMRDTAVLLLCLAGFLVMGGLIFYNTNILNRYEDSDERQRLSAVYEQRYRQYDANPQPLITAVHAEVDIYPGKRRAEIRGKYQLTNRGDEPVEELHLTFNTDLVRHTIDLPESSLKFRDDEVGYQVFTLPEAVLPGASMELEFTSTCEAQGFVNHGADSRLVANGTFFDNLAYMPRIGYLRSRELTNPTDRRKYDLEEAWQCREADDPVGLANGFFPDGDWIQFETIVSTSEDQVALAPGYLQREWREDGRRYFHYKMDSAIDNFYAFISGSWKIERSNWRDVAIEIYHHPDHAWNTGRMIEAVQDGLEYFTANFGPYPYRQFRIIEFPRYRRFAQSFPNTVPFSEAAHFITDLRDDDNIDMVYYITAHELAHQWWGNQVLPANVRGAQMLSESLAQYSALMVMEKSFGRERMQRFMAYELNNYLAGRGSCRTDELPLLDVEEQSHVYYQKGSLVFYALRDYIGEENLNLALRRFCTDNASAGPPFPAGPELMARLREVTPPRYAYLLEDMFETITLYDNRTLTTESEALPAGRFKVRIGYDTSKFRADGRGLETEIEHNDWIEVGVFGLDDNGVEIALHLEKHQLRSGDGEIELIVEGQPVRAGLDPRNLLIDRVVEDNVKRING
ncbi:MAG: ABC transporter permease subunit [bacterium]|nr:ABC transporter permease subunit [bacterium]